METSPLNQDQARLSEIRRLAMEREKYAAILARLDEQIAELAGVPSKSKPHPGRRPSPETSRQAIRAAFGV